MAWPATWVRARTGIFGGARIAADHGQPDDQARADQGRGTYAGHSSADVQAPEEQSSETVERRIGSGDSHGADFGAGAGDVWRVRAGVAVDAPAQSAI